MLGAITDAGIAKVAPYTSVLEANRLMIERRTKRVLVLAEGQFDGIVTQREILKSIYDFCIFLASEEDKDLKDKVQTD